MQTYDWQSGLVYTEHLAQPPRSYPKFGAACGKRPRYVAPCRGTQKLQDIALRKVLCNLEQLTLENLEPLQDLLRERLWEAIKRHRLDTLDIWKLFLCLGVHIEDRVLHIHEGIVSGDVVRSISSPTCTWLTDLAIDDVQNADPTHLADLANIVNLRSLILVGNARGITDRLVRSWAELVENQDPKPFSKLQMLYVHGQRHLTPHAFRPVTAFPALTIFCTSYCGIKRTDTTIAEELGWEGFDGFKEQDHSSELLPWRLASSLQHEFLGRFSGNEHTPMLDVKAQSGMHSTIKSRVCDTSKVCCLKRDTTSGYINCLPSSPAAKPLPEPSTRRSAPRPKTTKRRKLNGGRLLDLQSVLAEL
ncbi:hypothetical protein K431DRAFT_288742 [Polychaeton citri CBS 116435]|uniref:Uncharacterized protein n=1 Tax=Polychaeton citri CBS 116435 TaxID=1314669 RepID=A0A9P4Q2L0_9PEZI|nr:hypothetical protein K431DRAFT_288742 [Polychaeton citri CBS 116435]